MSGLREEITRRFRIRTSPARATPSEGLGRTTDSRAAPKSAEDPLSSGGAGSRPVLASSERDQAETQLRQDSREGTQIASYRILRRLGVGGMGHVYLALDTRLGRHVALKFLPPHLLTDATMLRRLEQEARTASALNHPNILTIYEIVETPTELFIASEFVEGVTLRQALLHDAVDPALALRIAVQTASALQAAHHAGIIHRDLKPANIMLRPDGYVKVIDFGLAKMTGGGHPQGLSSPGSVAGTADYMSPEQARGEELDHRTDLWSLGVVLFEMLARRRPFEGQTESHVIVAILDHPVPALPSAAHLTPAHGRIMQRALAKDPAHRYPSAQELLADLEALEPVSSRRLRLAPEHPRRRFVKPAAILLATLIPLAAALWFFAFGGRDRLLEPDWFQIESVRRVTFNGRTLISAISPDGKYLAFVVGDPGGLQSLHLKQLDQTSDETRIPARPISYDGLTFSPDSRTVYEVETDEQTLVGKLYAIPVLGDLPTAPLIIDIDGPVAFSPDGNQLAFVRYAGHRSLILAGHVGTTPPKTIFDSSAIGLLKHLVWLPGRDEIAAIASDPARPAKNLALKTLSQNGHAALRDLPDWNSAGAIVWDKQAKSLLLTASSGTEAKSQSQIRELSLATGKSHDLTTDLNGYRSLSITQNANQIATVKMDSQATIWTSAPNDFGHWQSTLAEIQDSATLAWINSDDLLVNSRRTGYPNLAILHTRTQTETPLTNEPFMEQHGSPIPGTSSVLFSSNRSGGFHIWSFNPQNQQMKQLTFGESYDDTPVVSPDGHFFVYTSWSSQTPALYRLPINGGTPMRISPNAAKEPQISPDGRSVACRIETGAGSRSIAVLSLAQSGSPRLVAKAHLPFKWAPANDALISSVTDARGVSNLWRIPLDGSPAQRLTDFDNQSILAFAWSPDGVRLAALRQAQDSDVVVLRRRTAR